MPVAVHALPTPPRDQSTQRHHHKLPPCEHSNDLSASSVALLRECRPTLEERTATVSSAAGGCVIAPSISKRNAIGDARRSRMRDARRGTCPPNATAGSINAASSPQAPTLRAFQRSQRVFRRSVKGVPPHSRRKNSHGVERGWRLRHRALNLEAECYWRCAAVPDEGCPSRYMPSQRHRGINQRSVITTSSHPASIPTISARLPSLC